MSANPIQFDLSLSQPAILGRLPQKSNSRPAQSHNPTPISIANRWLAPARLRFTAVAILVVCTAMLAVSITTARQNQTVFGPTLGADYAAFYNAGQIVNHNPQQLYNLDLHARLYHQLFPTEAAQFSLPYANAPTFALLFSPLAPLPYATSYVLWTVLSISLFAAGFTLAWRAARLPEKHFLTGLLLALSFEPFIIECIHGGQVSAVAFFFICAALYLHSRGHHLRAGLALGLCFYKPTLLPLLLPMLLLTKQWRTLLGVALSATIAAAISIAILGLDVHTQYLHLLLGYAAKSTGGKTFFQTWKFIDANSFFKLLFNGPSKIGWALLALIAATFALPLFKAWRRFDQSATTRNTAFAATLTCTLFLNLYVGVYDSILVIPAILLTLANPNRATITKWVLVGIYLLPWFSGQIAHSIGFQPYTLALAALAIIQLRQTASPARCLINSESRRSNVANATMTFA